MQHERATLYEKCLLLLEALQGNNQNQGLRSYKQKVYEGGGLVHTVGHLTAAITTGGGSK